MSLTIDLDRSDPARARVELGGRLDSITAPELEKKLDELLSGSSSTIVFDVAKLEYVSSAGVRCFARAQKALRQKNGEALLVNVKPFVKKVLDLVKALPGKNFFDSTKDLDQYLDYQIRHLK